MERKRLGAFALALAIAVAAALGCGAGVMRVDRKCAADWRDGTFVGDGQTALIAFAPHHFEWVVNRNDVIDGRWNDDPLLPHSEVMRRVADGPLRNSMFLEEADGTNGRHEHRDTITPAVLRLRFWRGLGWSSPAAPEMTEILDMSRGELEMRAFSGKVDAEVVCCVDRSSDVAAFRMRRGRRAVLEMVRPENPLLAPPEWNARAGAIVMRQRLPDGNVYAAALAVSSGAEPKAAALAGEFGCIPEDCEFFVAVRTTRETPDPSDAALAAVRSALAEGFDAVAGRNRRWWADFWARGGDVTLESAPEVDLAWHQCLFSLACSYGKPPMPGLNGLVYGPLNSTAAGIGYSDWTHDQNVQIPMFGFYPANHCEFARSFAASYERVRGVLEERTRRLYGARGIGLPLALNQDGRENATGCYRYSLCGSAYSALVLAQAWRYSRDMELLRDIYPLMRDFVEFNLSLMHKDATGRYELDWMVPPEIFTMTRNELAAVSCLRTSLETLLEASEALGVDEGRRGAWRDVLANYPLLVRQGEGGWWCGPDVPDDHAMWGGHLFYPFYPAECAIDAASRETALKTIDYLFKYGYDISYFSAEPHPVHDWTAYYLYAATLRLKPQEGWKAVGDFMRLFRKPNGFFSHNAILVEDVETARRGLEGAPRPTRRIWDGSTVTIRGDSDDVTPNPAAKRLAAPVIEGFGAFLFLSTESLLQSWDGEIRVFPCVPPGFTGSFTNLLARGGVRVSAAMKDGRLVSKTVVPPR